MIRYKNYLIELSSAKLVSKITDNIIPQIKKWQNRPLESVYPFLFMKIFIDESSSKTIFWY